jgi:hypothetical protein
MRPHTRKEMMSFIDNLLYVWSYFLKVARNIYRDSAPLFKRYGLAHPNSCTSELSSEKAKVRFIFASIVLRRLVMHVGKGAQHSI